MSLEDVPDIGRQLAASGVIGGGGGGGAPTPGGLGGGNGLLSILLPLLPSQPMLNRQGIMGTQIPGLLGPVNGPCTALAASFKACVVEKGYFENLTTAGLENKTGAVITDVPIDQSGLLHSGLPRVSSFAELVGGGGPEIG